MNQTEINNEINNKKNVSQKYENISNSKNFKFNQKNKFQQLTSKLRTRFKELATETINEDEISKLM